MPPEQVFALIEHDGRMYDLAAFVQHLSPLEIQEIGATAPRSGRRCGTRWCGAGLHWQRRSWRERDRRGEATAGNSSTLDSDQPPKGKRLRSHAAS
jgi:hypothetical protein